MTANGQRIREAREAAAAWSKTLGKLPQGDIGAYLLELVQTLAFEHLNTLAEGDKKPDVQHVTQLALAIRRLEEANLAADKRLAAAARAAVGAMSKGGVSEATIQEVRQKILGTG